MIQGKKIVIVSDGSGRTARRLLDAVLVQYSEGDLEFYIDNVYSGVRLKKELSSILKQIDDSFLVLYSIVSKDQRSFFSMKLRRRKILHLDVMKPMMDTMSKFLGFHPDYKPGLLQILDERYYEKVDSIGYTVKHDDGRGRTLDNAEAILIGPSRTCKTPISMYLACNYGLRVANIPMVREATLIENLLEQLEEIPPQRVIGLFMQPEVLSRVREARVKAMLHNDIHKLQMSNYYDRREVAGEVRYCRDLYVTHGWQAVDVTRRAIEEVSLEILKKLGRPT